MHSCVSSVCSDELSRAIQDSADLGVSVAVQQFDNVGYGFDYTLANADAQRWAARYTDDLLRQLATTTSERVGPGAGAVDSATASRWRR